MKRSRNDLLGAVPGLTEPFLDTCLAQGWIRPSRSDDEDMFLEIDAARLRLILELRRDFAVTDETMPLVLSLLDQVHDLRRSAARLETELAGQNKTPKRPKRRIPVRAIASPPPRHAKK